MTTASKWLILPLLIGSLESAPAEDRVAVEQVQTFDGWQVAIRPLTRFDQVVAVGSEAAGPDIVIAPAAPAQPAEATAPEPQPAPQETAAMRGPVIDPADYQSVYESIPFYRSEYDSNPTYRHDATMEILFGQLRPMVVQRTVRMYDDPQFRPDWGSFTPYGPAWGPHPYFRFYNPYWRWYGFPHGFW